MSGGRLLAVIGGGLIGLSVAEELIRRGRKVTLFEPGPCAAAATPAAGGMLGSVAEAEIHEDGWLRLALDSRDRYPRWIAELERLSGVECGYRREGTLFVAADHDELGELQRLVSILNRKQLEVEELDPQALLTLEPHLTGRLLAGIRIVADRQVEPRALLQALRVAFERGGGELRRMHVDRVHVADAGGFQLEGRLDGEAVSDAFDEVIVAAGAWCENGLELPLPRLQLRPVKGQLLRLRGERLLSHVVRSSEVYLIPREDGELLVGATSEEMGFDESPTAGAAMDLLRAAWELLPGSYDLKLEEHCVGLRSAGADHLPWIGPTPVEGLYLAAGHYRNGVLLAPATAVLLAECIESGVTPPMLEPFAPDLRMRQNTTHEH